MLLNSRQFKFLKNYRNVYVKSSAKRECRVENVFFKGDRALSKLMTLILASEARDENVRAKQANFFFINKVYSLGNDTNLLK